MTAFDLDAARPRNPGASSRLAALFARWERMRARRAARAHLLDQPDSILRDIGLTRDEVRSWSLLDSRFADESRRR